MNKAVLSKVTMSAVMVLLCGCATSPSASSIRNSKAKQCAETKLNQMYDGNLKAIEDVHWLFNVKIPNTLNQNTHKLTGPAQNGLAFYFIYGVVNRLQFQQAVNAKKISENLAVKAAETNSARLYCYAGYLSPGGPGFGLRPGLNSSYSSYKMQTQAFNYFNKSAQLGYKPANFFVGLYYLYGAGVPQNFKQALYYLKKSPSKLTILGARFVPALFISNIYADRASGYTNYFKAYHYVWLAEHAQSGTDNGKPVYPNDKSLSLHGTAINICSNSRMGIDSIQEVLDMEKKWIGFFDYEGMMKENGLGASLPKNFSGSYGGYVGKFLHRLTGEAVKLKYIPALEYNLKPFDTSDATYQHLLTLYNTYGDNASGLCSYYDQSGIMPANVKETVMAQTGGPCGNLRVSEEALNLMGKYVPCSNVEQGPQYIHKAIEMVEARYPAEH